MTDSSASCADTVLSLLWQQKRDDDRHGHDARASQVQHVRVDRGKQQVFPPARLQQDDARLSGKRLGRYTYVCVCVCVFVCRCVYVFVCVCVSDRGQIFKF